MSSSKGKGKSSTGNKRPRGTGTSSGTSRPNTKRNTREPCQGQTPIKWNWWAYGKEKPRGINHEFKCLWKECDFESDDLEEVKAHQQSVHQQSYCCDTCSREFPREKFLREHLKETGHE